MADPGAGNPAMPNPVWEKGNKMEGRGMGTGAVRRSKKVKEGGEGREKWGEGEGKREGEREGRKRSGMAPNFIA